MISRRSLFDMPENHEAVVPVRTYPIRAVSQLTGISIDLLRVWERRYQAVRPSRSGRGRVYLDSDVRRLDLLRRLVDAGHAIGTIAGLADRELDSLAEAQEAMRLEDGRHPGVAHRPGRTDLSILKNAIENFDGETLDREMARLATLMGPTALVRDVVQPVMCWVGEQWEAGSIGIAQEHIASMSLRNMLGSLVRVYSRSRSGPPVVFATPTGQNHEFGILCAALMAVGGGLTAVYLGTDVPADDIVRTANARRASAVVLGVAVANPEHDAAAAVSAVALGVAEGVEVWVGGCQDGALRERLRGIRATYIGDFDELERHLVRIGADCS